MLRATLQKVNELWKKEGLSLAKPLLPTQLTRAFEKFNIPISKDVIEVYSTLGGMEDCESELFFSFWSIDQILEENEPNSEFIAFADFSIYAHLYYFEYETELTSSIHIWWSEKDIEKIADSFEEFFENYLINPEKYYLFEREENKKEKKTIIQL